MYLGYARISKDDVYEKMVSCSLDFMNPIGGAINLKNLAELLKTSRYRVKKYIDELKIEGLVELKCVAIPYDEYESDAYPPYWGYVLTEKGRKTKYYKEQEKIEYELIKKHFGV